MRRIRLRGVEATFHSDLTWTSDFQPFADFLTEASKWERKGVRPSDGHPTIATFRNVAESVHAEIIENTGPEDSEGPGLAEGDVY